MGRHNYMISMFPLIQSLLSYCKNKEEYILKLRKKFSFILIQKFYKDI